MIITVYKINRGNILIRIKEKPRLFRIEALSHPCNWITLAILYETRHLYQYAYKYEHQNSLVALE